jgi:HAMP domain-containing protein
MNAHLKTSLVSGAGPLLAACYGLGALSGQYLGPAAAMILGIIVCTVLLLVLRRAWRRAVTVPVETLLDHIRIMRRGTWTRALPVPQSGEIGRLAAAINDLGEDLTFAAYQFATTSKLAAVAMIENRVGRRLNLAAEHLASIVTLLTMSRDYRQPIPEAAIRNLELAMKDLREIEAECKKEFEREFRSHSQEGNAVRANRAPASKARETVASP